MSYGAFLRFEKNNVDSIQFVDRDANGYERESWVKLGDCYSLGGFINGHLYRGKYWSFDYDIMGGLSFWTRHGNEFIGSVTNVHLAIDAGPTFMIENNLQLERQEVSLTHRSPLLSGGCPARRKTSTCRSACLPCRNLLGKGCRFPAKP